nr:hypothetical protein [Tanacetum cinerariifolium]
MTYPVTILTLDSARSYVMQGASFTQGIVSSIPIGGSLSHGGFLPSILLLVVVMVAVVIVVVTIILVVIVVVKVVIVVAIIRVVVVVDGVSSILKLSFVIIGVSLGPGFLLGLSVLIACVSRVAAIPSSSGDIVDLIGDEDPTDEDGDTEVLVSLGVISSEGKKSWESDIGDCNNTGDEGKTAGRVIITWGGEIALYACMASIYDHHVKEYRKIVRKVRRGKSILNVEIRWDDNRVVG